MAGWAINLVLFLRDRSATARIKVTVVVTTNLETGLINSFRTFLTLVPVRYLFWLQFGATVALALRFFYKPFSDKCGAAYRAALQHPMKAHRRRKLGV